MLRAGYGIFHARLQTGLLNTFFLENGLYQKAISLATNNAADAALAPVFPNRLAGIDRNPPAGTVNVTMAAKDFRTPYTQQGDVALEHEVTRNLGVTVNYIWSRGLHLTSVTDINVGPFGDPVTYRINDASGSQVGTYTTPTYRRGLRPNSNWAGINVVDAGGNSYYNALAVQVRKRLSRGLKARSPTPGRTPSTTSAAATAAAATTTSSSPVVPLRTTTATTVPKRAPRCSTSATASPSARYGRR